MSGPLLTFHHHGLAVKSPDDAFCFLHTLGYTIGGALFDPLQRVRLALCTHDAMPTVEVVWPGDGPSPIDRILRGGPSIYHTCYATPDAAAWIESVQQGGVDIVEISPPTPAILFGGRHVSFHFVSGVGVVELLHLDTAARPDGAASSEAPAAVDLSKLLNLSILTGGTA